MDFEEIDGFGVHTQTRPFVLTIEARGAFRINGEAVFDADGHNRKRPRLAPPVRLAVNELRALIETAPRWSIAISARGIVVDAPLAMNALTRQSITYAAMVVAYRLSSSSVIDRQMHAAEHGHDERVRKENLSTVLNAMGALQTLRPLLSRIVANERAQPVRLLAAKALDIIDDKPFATLFNGKEATSLVATLTPQQLREWEPLLLEKMDHGDERLGTAIAQRLAEHGTLAALFEIEREMKEKVFNRSYKKALQAAAKQLRDRLPPVGAVSIAAGGELSLRK